jgi:gamma-glutamyltranspeptidase
MGRDFGSGTMARASGVVLAADRPIAEAALAPVVGANMNTDQAYFAAGASGGWPAALAVALTVRRVLDDRESIEQAVGAPRAAQAGEDAPVLAETAMAAQLPGATEVPGLARVQAVWCSNGGKSDPGLCRGAADPRGFGLAADGR